MRTRMGLGFAALLLTSACTASVFTSPSADGDGAGTVPATSGGQPQNCSATKLPTDDACVVNDFEGVFVSSSMGKSSGTGTKADPLASLQAAIGAAKKAKKRVYACAETYAEQVQFQDGVDVFGYFACRSDWGVGGAHAKVNAPASPAATASNITTATRVEAVDLYAPNFASGSQSSIALIANASPALQIVHATVHAGTGGRGTDGANAIQLADSGTAKNGHDAWPDGVCTGGVCVAVMYGHPLGGTNACTGASGHDGNSGGDGGSAGQYQSAFFGNGYVWNVVGGDFSTVGNPTVPTAQTAQGGGFGQGGSAGAPGADGSDGAPGDAIGTINANGYVSSDGTDGTSGQPGQGGGGSGAYTTLSSDYSAASYPGKYGWNEPGAGGGAGGCPGLAASAGKGGGASIAVIAVASPMTLDTVKIETSAGGDAGAAGVPSAPTAGGSGGKAYYHTVPGGNGGAGGRAGISGNGAGGPSIGIASHGGAPEQLATTIAVGAGGNGIAARNTQGGSLPASPNGASQATYAF